MIVGCRAEDHIADREDTAVSRGHGIAARGGRHGLQRHILYPDRRAGLGDEAIIANTIDDDEIRAARMALKDQLSGGDRADRGTSTFTAGGISTVRQPDRDGLAGEIEIRLYPVIGVLSGRPRVPRTPIPGRVRSTRRT